MADCHLSASVLGSSAQKDANTHIKNRGAKRVGKGKGLIPSEAKGTLNALESTINHVRFEYISVSYQALSCRRKSFPATE